MRDRLGCRNLDSPMTAKISQTVTIKKYQTRRLYNTATCKYTTLESLAAMVRDGADFQVLDAKTGEDITRPTLIQIILEQESKRGQNLLPIHSFANSACSTATLCRCR
jgi:polyhydroxyalkanoate synthesis repressor PhaR